MKNLTGEENVLEWIYGNCCTTGKVAKNHWIVYKIDAQNNLREVILKLPVALQQHLLLT